MLGGPYLHAKGKGGNSDQTVRGNPELQTTQVKRGTQEIEDRYICTLTDKEVDLGRRYHPSLTLSSFNPCVQGRSKGGV